MYKNIFFPLLFYLLFLLLLTVLNFLNSFFLFFFYLNIFYIFVFLSSSVKIVNSFVFILINLSINHIWTCTLTSKFMLQLPLVDLWLLSIAFDLQFISFHCFLTHSVFFRSLTEKDERNQIEKKEYEYLLL